MKKGEISFEVSEEEQEFIQKAAEKKGLDVEAYAKENTLNGGRKRYKDKRIKEELAQIQAELNDFREEAIKENQKWAVERLDNVELEVNKIWRF